MRDKEIQEMESLRLSREADRLNRKFMLMDRASEDPHILGREVAQKISYGTTYTGGTDRETVEMWIVAAIGRAVRGELKVIDDLEQRLRKTKRVAVRDRKALEEIREFIIDTRGKPRITAFEIVIKVAAIVEEALQEENGGDMPGLPVRLAIKEMTTPDLKELSKEMTLNGDPQDPSDRQFLAELVQEIENRKRSGGE